MFDDILTPHSMTNLVNVALFLDFLILDRVLIFLVNPLSLYQYRKRNYMFARL